MKQYEIKLTSGEADWNEIPVLSIDCEYPGNPDGIRAFAQICYDESALKLHLWTTESETRAVETGTLGSPCEDSCLEFFFCPMENDNRYFNIEFNSNACLFLGFGSSVDNLVRLLPEEGISLFSPDIKTYENGWEIFYKIPFEFIRRFFPDFKAISGKIIRANCYKCSDLGNYPHYLSWSKVSTNPFTFHNPKCFGEMKFIK